ncbi:MAG: hypothetical protein NTW19_01040 [Planctomycetota bacterium]|nr:hypothetical protein [Planctomycetota bacterium]
MSMREIGRERGRAAAKQVRDTIDELMKRDMRMNAELFPTLGPGHSMAAAVLAYDRERLDCTPDYTKFPEMRGLADRNIGEREGFLDGSGLSPVHAAYHFSFGHYIWKRVNSKHVARYDLATPHTQCTNVFFPQGKDGVVASDNRDDVPRPWYTHLKDYKIGKIPADHKVGWRQGGVSSATLLDDEPACIFPYDPYEFISEDCLGDIREIVKFMSDRRDFFGPGNQIWVDKNLNAVAVEKANVRIAFHWPKVNGAVCITACSYLDPELGAFKKACTRKAAALKGLKAEEDIDWMFFEGCDARHRRLWALTEAEAGRPGGATLWGAFNVVADTEVPFPDRICLAGEKTDPLREPNTNWTLTQQAHVMTGPKRRALYRSIPDADNPKPITTYKPKFTLGEGVKMEPEWQADVDAGRCVLVE